ncbi:ATPase activity protein [Cryphonectria parasitica EP155]|uniref:P-type Na(+) transporter n=1 Tax=Cryphonectria parasitica (strain ATCC 38755 / EP155) TaxID=660469 RepID=A0A9P5CR57_CRYP1|nr:ATPase activity protein [Cryphonectria parasitica EP155]KAF3767192.1 ATPase activity protein [Cryphonectria parasitica EP155]
MSGQFARHPFLLPAAEVIAALETSIDHGLSSTQVAHRQQEYPRNELIVEGAIAWHTIFIKQLCNAMILVLIVATIVSFAIQDWVEGGVLAFVICLNVSIGFVQEYRAEKKMDALRALSSPSATVLRDGKLKVVANPEVVPGDVVILKMGDTVPADLRMFEVMNLSCDEQSLTGEAAPVEKMTENEIFVPGTEKPATSEEEVGIGDRINIAYATTCVQKGRGRGVVIATGMKTEVGKIAASTTKKRRKPGRSMNWRKYGRAAPVKGASRRIYDFFGKFLGLTEGTPLQKRLSQLAYLLFLFALILAVIVFGVNRFTMSNEVIIYAISLGIAIIPESLVAVLTLTMVVATTVMTKSNVVVSFCNRDLSALEALGGVTNICSDKTGTLTQGAMIVRKVWLPLSNVYSVRDSEDPNNPTVGRVTYRKVPLEAPKPPGGDRDFDHERSAPALKFDVPDEKAGSRKTEDAEEAEAEPNPALHAFLLAASLCNLATVRYDEHQSQWHTTGEPTEIALQVFSHRFEVRKKQLESAGWSQAAEFPFDSSIKRMSVIYNAPEGNPFGVSSSHSLVYTKGAVERVLDLCSTVGVGEDQCPLTDDLKDKVLAQMDSLASQGLRVLAIASRAWDGRFKSITANTQANDDTMRSQIESELTLLGLAGIYDPPRRETTPALAECASAGIKVHMLTGDHPATATAIAKEVGIIPRNLSILPPAVANSIVFKATDFDKLSDAEVDALDELPLVIARCAPDTKTRMIEALRRRRAFAAMTGDGVNDAPSLSNADVGIAMGSGSDVAKSAAKIVLTDDKFNSIVAAIREGRRMFDNIQKFILHLLASNVGEVVLLIVGLAFKDASGLSVFPVSPLSILWINMITSSCPAFGLGREKASSDIMRKPPHSKGIFTWQVIVDMIVYGTLMGACCLATFIIVIYGANSGNLGLDCNRAFSEACRPVFRARAAVFAELTWLILISAWEFKHLRRSMFVLYPEKAGIVQFLRDMYDNRFLFWAVFAGAMSVFVTVNVPQLNTNVFKHAPITWEWSLVVGFTVLYVTGVETWKAVKRIYGILDDHAVVHGSFSQGSVEGRTISSVMSFSSLRQWGSFRRKDTGDTAYSGEGHALRR